MAAKGILWVSAFLMALMSVRDSAAREFPVEHFFREYGTSNVKISPGGKYLAMVRNDGTNSYLVSLDLNTRQRQIVCSGELLNYVWIGDDRLVVGGGGEYRGGMFAVDRDGRRQKALLQPAETQATEVSLTGKVPFYLRLYGVLEHRSKDFPFILTSSQDLSSWGYALEKPVVYRVNTLTGNSIMVERNPGYVVQWFTDHDGQVRLALAVQKETARLLYRAQKDQPWETVFECKNLKEDVLPLGFAPDNQRFYVAVRGGQDTLGLYLFDPSSKALGECLWRHPRYDLRGVTLAPVSRQVTAVLYDAERLEYHWFDTTNRALVGRIAKALPGMITRTISESEDGSKTVYFAYNDRTPGAYYLFQANSNKLDRVAEVSPWIRPEEMAEMRLIHYTTRDGLQIEGYLTLPKGREPKSLPLVVLVHDGPWMRDTWGFDPRVQFLANRGYAVLQPNYRGSTGYGLAFLEAGYKERGFKFHEDLADGVAWAVREGFADPKRVALFGKSFGGFAAMMALSAAPELYRCAVSYSGLTALKDQIRYTTCYAPTPAQKLPDTRTNDNRDDKDLLPEISLVNQMPRIASPVMLIYGGQDYRVSSDQGRRLEKALKANGKNCEFIYEHNEDHTFTASTNVFKLYNRIDAFLRKHMQ